MIGDWKKLKLGTNDYWVYDGPNVGYSSITLDTGIVCNTGGIVMQNNVDLEYYMNQRIAGMHEMTGLSIAEQLFRHNESRLSLKNESAVEVGSITSLRGVETGVSEFYCTMSYMHNDNRYVDVSDTTYPTYRANAVYYVKFKILGPSNLLNGSSSHWYIRLQKGNTTKNIQINPVVTYVHESVWVDGGATAYVDSLNGGDIYYNNASTGVGVSFTTTGHYFLSFIFTNNKEQLGISYFQVQTIDNQPKFGKLLMGASNHIDISDVSDDPTPVEEDGYVNELMDRFSPRYWAGSLGIYLIPTDSIADVMQAMMELDASDLLKNIFFGTDGKEYIIGLKWYYGMLQNPGGHYNGNISMSADRKEIKVGNVNLDLDNVPLYAHIASSEFATWTSSEIVVPEHFGNYLDYQTSYQLYIPYYGFLELSPNDVVGGRLQLIYNINLVSGTADIVVVCRNSRTDNKSTKYYTVNAQIGIDVPYGSDMMKTLSANWAQTCGKAFVTGAKMGAFGATQEYMNFLGQNEAAGNLLNDSGIEVDEGLDRSALKRDLKSERRGSTFRYAASQAPNAMDALQNGVSTPSRSGSFSNESGSLDELHPYLLITRPVTAAPSDYEDYVGMPSAESVTLSTVSGFTQVAAVKPLSTYTDAPKYLPEIISLLQAGVYL